MRSRALVLVLALALGGLAVVGARVDAHVAQVRAANAALVRLPLDAPAPGPAVRTREQLDRDSATTRPQILAVLASLTIAALGAWWIVVRRRIDRRVACTPTDARPRAPPSLFASVPSS